MKEIYRSERSEAMADIYKDVMYINYLYFNHYDNSQTNGERKSKSFIYGSAGSCMAGCTV